jgi:putative FmdB family regulatory protein
MPIYAYHVDEPCDLCPSGEQEHLQKMSDAPFTACPWCGKAIHRVIGLPLRVVTGHNYKLTDSAIAKSGMTKYANRGDGTYEKVAGPDEAPKVVSKQALEKMQGGG